MLKASVETEQLGGSLIRISSLVNCSIEGDDDVALSD